MNIESVIIRPPHHSITLYLLHTHTQTQHTHTMNKWYNFQFTIISIHLRIVSSTIYIDNIYREEKTKKRKQNTDEPNDLSSAVHWSDANLATQFEKKRKQKNKCVKEKYIFVIILKRYSKKKYTGIINKRVYFIFYFINQFVLLLFLFLNRDTNEPRPFVFLNILKKRERKREKQIKKKFKKNEN